MGQKSLTEDVKWQVIGLYKGSNKSYREISSILEISKTAVANVVAKFERCRTVADMPRIGRSRTTTERKDRLIQQIEKKNRKASLPDLVTATRKATGIQLDASIFLVA